MEQEKTRFGKLTLNYKSDEKSFHCTCDCGLKIILTSEQLEQATCCGCTKRRIIRAAVGMSDDSYMANEMPSDKIPDGRGVNFDKKKGKWRARVTFQSKEYHLGYFATKEKALAVKQEADRNLNIDFLDWFNKVIKKIRTSVKDNCL